MEPRNDRDEPVGPIEDYNEDRLKDLLNRPEVDHVRVFRKKVDKARKKNKAARMARRKNRKK